MEQKKDHPKNSPIKRREFFKLCGSVVAGGTILAVAGGMARRVEGTEARFLLANRSECMYAMRTLRDTLRVTCLGRKMYSCE